MAARASLIHSHSDLPVESVIGHGDCHNEVELRREGHKKCHGHPSFGVHDEHVDDEHHHDDDVDEHHDDLDHRARSHDD